MGCERAGMGFTLLEVLLALFIFSLVASAALGAYRGTLGVMDEAGVQETIYQAARISLERIALDLASAYVPQAASSAQRETANAEKVVFQGERKEIGDLPSAELRFWSLAHIRFSEESPIAEPAEIAYYGVAGEEKGVLDLYRSDTPLSRDRPEPGTGGVLLCKGLSSLSFIYYDAEGEPHEEWDGRVGASSGRLPSRVAVRMEFPNPKDPTRPYRFMTGVAIPQGG